MARSIGAGDPGAAVTTGFGGTDTSGMQADGSVAGNRGREPVDLWKVAKTGFLPKWPKRSQPRAGDTAQEAGEGQQVSGELSAVAMAMEMPRSRLGSAMMARLGTLPDVESDQLEIDQAETASARKGANATGWNPLKDWHPVEDVQVGLTVLEAFTPMVATAVPIPEFWRRVLNSELFRWLAFLALIGVPIIVYAQDTLGRRREERDILHFD